MGWLGKIIGGAFGFMMGGPLGAMFGAAFGHQFDHGGDERDPFRAEVESPDQYREQMAFFTATFAVMGHIAKADGRVNEAEIAQARKTMGRLQLNEGMRRTAVRLFNEGKRTGFPLDEALEQFRAECQGRFALVRLFVELQIELALADSAMDAAEERLLLRICERLRFSRFEFHALKTALEAQIRLGGGWQRQPGSVAGREPALADCYAALGVEASASEAEIRRAYRRLLSRHHPDKLAAEGMPEEKIRLANEKTHEIRKAWDALLRARDEGLDARHESHA